MEQSKLKMENEERIEKLSNYEKREKKDVCSDSIDFQYYRMLQTAFAKKGPAAA